MTHPRSDPRRLRRTPPPDHDDHKAAILGTLPSAFAVGTGEQLCSPLGIAVIGGLIVCQALILCTTPVIYLVLGGFDKRRARRIGVAQAE